MVDDPGDPVTDAVVSGDFSGDIVETVSASDPTDANGRTYLTDWSGSVCASN